jgi:hypothetical protein
VVDQLEVSRQRVAGAQWSLLGHGHLRRRAYGGATVDGRRREAGRG